MMKKSIVQVGEGIWYSNADQTVDGIEYKLGYYYQHDGSLIGPYRFSFEAMNDLNKASGNFF